MNETKKKIREFRQNAKEHREEFISTRKEYLLAVVENTRIEQIDHDSKKQVLTENHFFKTSCDFPEEEGERILDPKEDFLMSDDDFRHYLELCHIERTRRGLTIPEMDLSSNYKSFTAMKQAEERFVNVSLLLVPSSVRADIEKVKNNRGLKTYKAFIDLMLRLDTVEMTP